MSTAQRFLIAVDAALAATAEVRRLRRELIRESKKRQKQKPERSQKPRLFREEAARAQ